jgi:hypothetical protein
VTVLIPGPMKLQKMAVVVRQQSPSFGSGKGQNLGVGYGGVRLPGIERCQDIMTRTSQFLDKP